MKKKLYLCLYMTSDYHKKKLEKTIMKSHTLDNKKTPKKYLSFSKYMKKKWEMNVLIISSAQIHHLESWSEYRLLGQTFCSFLMPHWIEPNWFRKHMMSKVALKWLCCFDHHLAWNGIGTFLDLWILKILCFPPEQLWVA